MRTLPPILLMPVVFFAILLVYTKVAGPLPLSVSSVVTQKNDAFNVSGEGKVTVVPDMATVTVGVSSEGTTTKQVQNDLNTKINTVSDGVKKLGIESKDIQTINYSLNPTYDYQSPRQRITGYQGSTNLSIKVRDLDKANDVIDVATQQGANMVGGISFDVSDKTESENKARQMAFQEARRKAESAAQIAGFHLGKIINYQENFGGGAVPVPMMARAADAEMLKEATQVQPGSQEIQVTVTLSYEIE